jgi:hypothetical protein
VLTVASLRPASVEELEVDVFLVCVEVVFRSVPGS